MPRLNNTTNVLTITHTGWHSQRVSHCLYYTANIMFDVNVKMLFTLFCKSLIYYTKFENCLLSFLTFTIYC